MSNPVLLASPVLRFSVGYLAGVHARVHDSTMGVISYEGMCQTEHKKCWLFVETEFAACLAGRMAACVRRMTLCDNLRGRLILKSAVVR